MSRVIRFTVAISLALTLAACGGGGDGGEMDDAMRPPANGDTRDDQPSAPVHAVGLYGVHGLADWLTANPGGSVTVPAGEHRDAGGVRFSCPADGADCRVTATHGDGAIMVSSMGGAASAEVINPQYWILQSADSLLMSDSLARTLFGEIRVQTDCTGTVCTLSARGYPTQHTSLSEWRGTLAGNLTPDKPTTVTETHRGVSLNLLDDYDGWLSYSAFVAGRGSALSETYPASLSFGVVAGSSPTRGSAVWSGVMAGVDVSTTRYRNRIRGDADLTIADFTDPKVDVAFTNIRDVDAGRVLADMTWADVPMTKGGFGTGSDGDSIKGKFYGPNHEEVGGVFEREQVIGAFGAKRP